MDEIVVGNATVEGDRKDLPKVVFARSLPEADAAPEGDAFLCSLGALAAGGHGTG